MQNRMDETNQGFMDRRPANHVPLTPLSFISRIAAIYPDHEAVVYHDRRYSWSQTYRRCIQLADALIKAGLKRGEVVTIMAPNIPEMVEAHFGVAMAGGVLNTMNTRLDTDTIAYILDHAETRFLLTDAAFSAQMSQALQKADNKQMTIIDIIDRHDAESASAPLLGDMDYDAFIATGCPDYAWEMPQDEWDAMALNYTSGTSGKPKGVVYHHRGAYLMAMGTIPVWSLPAHPRYLYTVPLFHCNGWGHAWMMAIVAGTIICCRKVAADAIFSLIREHKVTHFGGAPIVLSMLVNAEDNIKFSPDWNVQVMTAGAPPPAAILEKVETLGFTVTQVYGLTETYGHLSHCAWNSDWDELDFGEKAEIKARQGVHFAHTEAIQVLDQDTKQPVAADGVEMGEVMFRSNCIMKGYHKNPEATEEALADGYFKSGDLAVMHPNGYIEIKDRLKDIIISGGENISSVEVEGVLYRMAGVAFAAVVAKKDEKWGETPCAFIEMKPGHTATPEEVISFCREHLAGFKCPKTVIFTEIPKTSTGKLQKFKLRAQLD